MRAILYIYSLIISGNFSGEMVLYLNTSKTFVRWPKSIVCTSTDKSNANTVAVGPRAQRTIGLLMVFERLKTFWNKDSYSDHALIANPSILCFSFISLNNS